MFLSEKSLQEEIEKLVNQNKLDYIDAVIHFCQSNDIEPDEIKKLVSVNLKDKIRRSAIENGLMKPVSVLPL